MPALKRKGEGDARRGGLNTLQGRIKESPAALAPQPLTTLGRSYSAHTMTKRPDIQAQALQTCAPPLTAASGSNSAPSLASPSTTASSLRPITSASDLALDAPTAISRLVACDRGVARKPQGRGSGQQGGARPGTSKLLRSATQLCVGRTVLYQVPRHGLQPRLAHPAPSPAAAAESCPPVSAPAARFVAPHS